MYVARVTLGASRTDCLLSAFVTARGISQMNYNSLNPYKWQSYDGMTSLLTRRWGLRRNSLGMLHSEGKCFALCHILRCASVDDTNICERTISVEYDMTRGSGHHHRTRVPVQPRPLWSCSQSMPLRKSWSTRP